jgi:hypothetical protein
MARGLITAAPAGVRLEKHCPRLAVEQTQPLHFSNTASFNMVSVDRRGLAALGLTPKRDCWGHRDPNACRQTAQPLE